MDMLSHTQQRDSVVPDTMRRGYHDTTSDDLQTLSTLHRGTAIACMKPQRRSEQRTNMRTWTARESSGMFTLTLWL
jgi:hypothetical protein